jgi:hypothetical protein
MVTTASQTIRQLQLFAQEPLLDGVTGWTASFNQIRMNMAPVHHIWSALILEPLNILIGTTVSGERHAKTQEQLGRIPPVALSLTCHLDSGCNWKESGTEFSWKFSVGWCWVFFVLLYFGLSTIAYNILLSYCLAVVVKHYLAPP